MNQYATFNQPIVNNTYDAFKSFILTNLCTYLFDIKAKHLNKNFYKPEKIKGEILNNFNQTVCELGLNMLRKYELPTPGIPFSVIFDTHLLDTTVIPVNIRVATSKRFITSSTSIPYCETYSFQYIYIEGNNLIPSQYILIDINNTITLNPIDAFYNTPSSFLDFCKKHNYTPSEEISINSFYTKFKQLLSNASNLYTSHCFPSNTIFCVYDEATNETFLYTILYGEKTNHYVILKYLPCHLFGGISVVSAPFIPNYRFNDVYIQPF